MSWLIHVRWCVAPASLVLLSAAPTKRSRSAKNCDTTLMCGMQWWGAESYDTSVVSWVQGNHNKWISRWRSPGEDLSTLMIKRGPGRAAKSCHDEQWWYGVGNWDHKDKVSIHKRPRFQRIVKVHKMPPFKGIGSKKSTDHKSEVEKFLNTHHTAVHTEPKVHKSPSNSTCG